MTPKDRQPTTPILTDGEIMSICDRTVVVKARQAGQTQVWMGIIARAQAKKIVEWGNEPCPHILTQIMDGSTTPKHKCDVCWKELEKGGDAVSH